MPYTINDELPAFRSRALADPRTGLFREAFNSAFERYDRDEAVAFRVAGGETTLRKDRRAVG